MIGSGPGGYVASIKAAQLGMNVCIKMKRLQSLFGGNPVLLGTLNQTTRTTASTTTSCKIVETLSLKNTFSSFQCPPYLEFKPLPLPLPPPPFNVDCLSSQHFFVLLATLIRGEGGCSVRDNREINYAPRRWSDSTIFATCCSFPFWACTLQKDVGLQTLCAYWI